MNNFRQPLLDLFGGGRSDRMLSAITLDRTPMPHTAGFAGLFFFAHAAKFTPIVGNIHLDRLLKCLTCEPWAKVLKWNWFTV